MKAITRVDVYTGGQWIFSTIDAQGAAVVIKQGADKFGLVIHGIYRR